MLSLNTQQQEAVETIQGPLLILAGAGTGKTKTLVTRIAHILNQGHATPQQIIAVTFTNKAAKEMSSRVLELTNTNINNLGTFHSIAAKILRRNAELADLTSNFTIIDQDDQLNLIKNIMSYMNPEYINSRDSRKKIKIIANIIQRWKDKALTPRNTFDVKNEGERAALDCYSLYQERLRGSNAVDFDDLLLHNISIFNSYPEILNSYQDRIKYIMVDEYQDTNTIQYLWLRLLAQKHKNICCVGDDDQSIYSWRGAQITNILKFSEYFPGAKVIKLEQNYRSTSHILAVAASVIGVNQNRLGKTLWTENNTGPKVRVMRCYDHKDEARKIISDIAQNKKFVDTAILVRTGSQMRAFEEYAIYYGVPYQIIGGLRFYDRKEIKDTISYLKVATNKNDDIAFERIINTPKRGIGDITFEKIRHAGFSERIPLIEAASRLIEQKEVKSEKLKALLKQINEWHELSKELPPQDLTDIILKSSGYMEMLSQENEIKSPSRKENIKEFINLLKDFGDINQFLEYVALVTTADNKNLNDGVSIMTLHAAKGLEFENVFLPGWEESLFPHERSIREGNVEEERRLAYVGITRAKENLCISFAERRFINHCWVNNRPSIFLDFFQKKTLKLVEKNPLQPKF